MCSPDIVFSPPPLNQVFNYLILAISDLLSWAKTHSTNSRGPIQILLASWGENGKLAPSEPKTACFQMLVWIWFLTEVLSTVGPLEAVCHHNWLNMYWVDTNTKLFKQIVHLLFSSTHFLLCTIMWAKVWPLQPEYAPRTRMQTEFKENHRSQDTTGLCPTVWQIMLLRTIAFVYPQSYLVSPQACNKLQRGESWPMKSNTSIPLQVLSKPHDFFFLSLTDAVWQTLALIQDKAALHIIKGRDLTRKYGQ